MIDSVFEPRLAQLAPAPGEPATPAFLHAEGAHLVVEVVATGLMYAAFILGTRL